MLIRFSFFSLFKSIPQNDFPHSFQSILTKLQTKRIELNLLFKLLYLNSNFALPPAYLNPALKKPARWVRSDKVEQSFLAEKRDLVELGPRNRATTPPILLRYFMAPLNKLLNHDLPPFSLQNSGDEREHTFLFFQKRQQRSPRLFQGSRIQIVPD